MKILFAKLLLCVRWLAQIFTILETVDIWVWHCLRTSQPIAWQFVENAIHTEEWQCPFFANGAYHFNEFIMCDSPFNFPTTSRIVYCDMLPKCKPKIWIKVYNCTSLCCGFNCLFMCFLHWKISQ